MNLITVSIVEDDEPTRLSLFQLIQGTPGFRVVGSHASAETALRQTSCEKPNVVLLDLELPGISGLEFIHRLKSRSPDQEILILTVHDDPKLIFDALEAGATGYLAKPVASAQIVEALAEVHGGGSPMSSQIARLVIRAFHQRGQSKRTLQQLTRREDEVLSLVSKGYTNKEIAEKLQISPRTVGTHLHNIFEKLHVNTRAAAASKYVGG